MVEEIFILRIIKKDDGTIESFSETNFKKDFENIAFTVHTLAMVTKKISELTLLQYNRVIDKEEVTDIKNKRLDSSV